ncbi:unnamed protein product [Cuscuta epithymum]|uniref:Uncharacterized protein n=1 Tax=Cuscuta epithymum TaxID=186058 RepID=A0AAV0C8U1_9ASTE|nr:unnamed protein product [Cuscuta epithymum]
MAIFSPKFWTLHLSSKNSGSSFPPPRNQVSMISLLPTHIFPIPIQSISCGRGSFKNFCLSPQMEGSASAEGYPNLKKLLGDMEFPTQEQKNHRAVIFWIVMRDDESELKKEFGELVEQFRTWLSFDNRLKVLFGQITHRIFMEACCSRLLENVDRWVCCSSIVHSNFTQLSQKIPMFMEPSFGFFRTKNTKDTIDGVMFMVMVGVEGDISDKCENLEELLQQLNTFEGKINSISPSCISVKLDKEKVEELEKYSQVTVGDYNL